MLSLCWKKKGEKGKKFLRRRLWWREVKWASRFVSSSLSRNVTTRGQRTNSIARGTKRINLILLLFLCWLTGWLTSYSFHSNNQSTMKTLYNNNNNIQPHLERALVCFSAGHMSTTPLILILNVPRRIIEMTGGKKEEKMEIFLPEKKTMSLSSRVYYYLIYLFDFFFVFLFFSVFECLLPWAERFLSIS